MLHIAYTIAFFYYTVAKQTCTMNEANGMKKSFRTHTHTPIHTSTVTHIRTERQRVRQTQTPSAWSTPSHGLFLLFRSQLKQTQRKRRCGTVRAKPNVAPRRCSSDFPSNLALYPHSDHNMRIHSRISWVLENVCGKMLSKCWCEKTHVRFSFVQFWKEFLE